MVGCNAPNCASLNLLRGPRSSWLNQARRNYLQAARIDGRLDSERELFACFFLCDTCGYLDTNKEHCRACGGRHLIDLGHSPTFYALEDAEGRDHTLRWGRTRRALGIGLALAGVVVGALATVVAYSPGAGFAMTIVAFIAAGVTLTGGSSPKVNTKRRKMLAPKWRGPLVVPTRRDRKRAAVAEGAVTATRTISSPISGTPCVAYRVRVRDEKGQLLLEEHHNVALELDGHAIPEGAAFVDGEGRSLTGCARLEKVRKWLRARGIRYLVGMTFTETVVEVGELADMRVSGTTPILEGKRRAAPIRYR